MKKIIQSLTIALALMSCEVNQAQKANSFIEDVNAKRFKELVDEGKGIVLDVRTSEEVAKGHINNASTIDYYDPEFVQKINLIAKDKEIYVYCQSGGRSSEAAKILQENGFHKIYNLENGIKGWEKEGYPLIKQDNQKDEHIQQLSLSEFEELLNTDKPVLIEFHTVWCAPCKKMAPIIDKLEEEFKDKAIVMRIDVDKSKEVGAAYEITGVPVFILFKKGEQIWKHNGMISEEELRKNIHLGI